MTLANGTAAVLLDIGAGLLGLDTLDDRAVVVGWTASGRRDRVDGHYWLTPNPQSGLTVRFAWPHVGLGTTGTHIPGEPLRAATAAAMALWP